MASDSVFIIVKEGNGYSKNLGAFLDLHSAQRAAWLRMFGEPPNRVEYIIEQWRLGSNPCEKKWSVGGFNFVNRKLESNKDFEKQITTFEEFLKQGTVPPELQLSSIY